MSLNPRIPFISKGNSSTSQDVLTIAKKIRDVKGANDCGFRIAECGLEKRKKGKADQKMRNDLDGTQMNAKTDIFCGPHPYELWASISW
jgi:hypothetical protein